ncbi:hypothetical protein V1512DRAFT_259773 [Lipomyces arxii]|uniref:uncharacterized protein n=1 Tax=Lipomyces arxii TaxID=56418 RepID=UPI0034CD6035
MVPRHEPHYPDTRSQFQIQYCLSKQMSSKLAIVLHPAHGSTFTSLDVIHGQIQLTIGSEETLADIHVKMEGVSRTLLVVPKHPEKTRKDGSPKRSKKTVIETHKILHQSTIVFPPDNVRNTDTKEGFTLPPGQYYYPFEFRIPINNKCLQSTSFMSKLSFADGAAYSRDPTQHLVATLPPSLSDVGGQAVIKYFFKVTVKRAAFYKPNKREYLPFVFLPFEPPRPDTHGEQFFVRRKHQFPYLPSHERIDGHAPTGPAIPPKKKGFLSALSAASRQAPFVRQSGPEFYLEARVPDPPIMTPAEPLPLHLFVSSASPLTVPLFLHALRVNLVARTLIAAQEHNRETAYGLTIHNSENLKLQMGQIVNPKPGTFEAEFDLRKCGQIVLPNTIPPSFKTCNVARKYSLEIFAKVSHSRHGEADIIALAFDIDVYSGVKPPRSLLDAAETAAKIAAEPNPYAVGPALESHAVPKHNDSLPTYDEAIGANLNPVQGPRREFQQNPAYYADLAEMDKDEKN